MQFDWGATFFWLPPNRPDRPSGVLPYTGTVTLAGTFEVNTLVVESGQIAQADPATLQPPVPYAPTAGTLTINSFMNWTGGTLNSNTVTGTIALAPGATGIAEPSFTNPGINQTVGLGSTIVLQGTTSGVPDEEDIDPGSSLDVLSGLYNIANGAGFVVNDSSNLNLLPEPDDAPPPSPPEPPAEYKASVDLKVVGAQGENLLSKKAIVVEANGTLTITAADRPPTSTEFAHVNYTEGSLQNNGGKVILTDRVKATFGGKMFSGNFIGAEPDLVWVYGSVVQSKATSILSLQAGSELVTTHGVVVNAGEVVSPALPDNTLNPYPKAVIQATDPGATTYAFFLGKDASVRLPGSPTRTVWIKGHFNWQGTVELALSPLDTTLFDRLQVDKKVEVKSPAKLKVYWSVPNNDADMANRDLGAAWHVITSGVNNGITGVDATTPQLILPTGTSVTMEVQLNQAKDILKVSKTSVRVPK